MLTAIAINCAAVINLCNSLTFFIIGKSVAGYRTGMNIVRLCKIKGKYEGGYLQMNNSFYSLPKLAV
jgi:hypothetical protein